MEHRLWAHGLQQLQHVGSVVGVHGLSCPKHAESSQIRDLTHVSCRWTLTQCTIREVLALFFNLCCITSEAVVIMVLHP